MEVIQGMTKHVKKAVVTLLLLAGAALLVAISPVGAAEGVGGDKGVVTHTVLEGDNLSLLAGYYYKDPRQWRRIYSPNSDVIDDPDTILPGTVLKIRTEPGKQWDIPYGDFVALVFR